MQSLDNVNGLLLDGYSIRIRKTAENVAALKCTLESNGWKLYNNDEPLKITIDARANGYDGRELATQLINNKIMPEYFDPDYVVLMFSAENDGNDLPTLKNVLKNIPIKNPIEKVFFQINSVSVMPMKQALESPSETIPVENAANRILACPTVSCPPAVPVLYGGEK